MVSLTLSAIGVVISIPAIYPCLVFFGGIGGAISLLVALYYFIRIRYTVSRYVSSISISLLKILPTIAVYPITVYYTIMVLYELFTFGRPPQLYELRYYWLLIYTVFYSIVIAILSVSPEELAGRRRLAMVMNIMAMTIVLAIYLVLPYPHRLALFVSPITITILIAESLKFRYKSLYKQKHKRHIEIEGEFV